MRLRIRTLGILGCSGLFWSVAAPMALGENESAGSANHSEGRAASPDPLARTQAAPRLNFHGGYSARAAMNQMPRRPPIRPNGGQPLRQAVKPFETVQEEPTISPYMNLYRDDDAMTAPNYYTFVRPQMQQLETNREQQRELERLRRQVQVMSTAPSGAQRPVTYSGASSAARYMDTAQFYAGWRR